MTRRMRTALRRIAAGAPTWRIPDRRSVLAVHARGLVAPSYRPEDGYQYRLTAAGRAALAEMGSAPSHPGRARAVDRPVIPVLVNVCWDSEKTTLWSRIRCAFAKYHAWGTGPSGRQVCVRCKLETWSEVKGLAPVADREEREG